MKERPILFNGPMARAILEGRKTVTRRVVKQNLKPHAEGSNWYSFDHKGINYRVNARHTTTQAWAHLLQFCPYGQPGDRLWVREAFLPDPDADHRSWDDWSDTYVSWSGCGSRIDGVPPALRTPEHCIYREGWDGGDLVWRPSIHMPRWASRILLEITAVRVERLQDGEGETAFESRYLAEGINRIHHGDGEYYYHAFESEPGPGNWIDPFDAWRELWTSVNGSTSWAANPWVWVVEFKVVTP